jgi:hypothetical protein
MKAGDQVRVWPQGDESRAGTAKVILVSDNQRSCALAFSDPSRCVNSENGVAIHPEHGIMLLLGRQQDSGPWSEAFHGAQYEVEALKP